MTDHPRPVPANPVPDERSPRLTRRHLVAGSAAAALGGPALRSLAQDESSPVPPDLATAEASPQASPNASPVTSPVADVNIDVFRAICQAATGVAELPEASVTQALDLIQADEASAAGLAEILAAGGGLDLDEVDGNARAALTNIVEFFYVGNFNGAPVENRADLFTGLVSFQALPYVTIPAVCKAYGYWAMDLDLPDRDAAALTLHAG